MGIIKQLDPHLTNMIAAGEVVERPMGIVKELVENAIDAKAQQVSVYVWQGGIEKIEVIDDGCGMDAADALMAFERHATSKLADPAQLWRIKTMGFRGEALPSIASVSHVRLKTNNGQEATQVEIAWGQLKHQGPCAMNQGTSIEVSNLFQKTPARLKHLKAANYEYALVLDVLQKFALAHPKIGFSLYHNDKLTFQSKGHPDLQNSIAEVYGIDLAKQTIAFHVQDADYAIDGFIGQPAVHRANKYYIVLFINGRMVRNQRLTKVICDAYSSYLPAGRYPFAVLHLTMDYQLVDVNVHPAKWEIRLSKASQLEQLLEEGIANALKHQFRPNVIHKVQESQPVQQLRFENPSQAQPSVALPAKEQELPVLVVPSTPTPASIHPPKGTPQQEHTNPISQEKGNTEIHPAWPQIRLIGQFANRYVLCEGMDGLYLIDQHAAHERINFEKLAQAAQSNQFHLKPLLLPLRFEVDHRIVDQLERINAQISSIGLTFEAFGRQSVLVREIPSWMQGSDEFAVLTDLLELVKNDQKIEVVALRKAAIESMACHSSIRFNRSLHHHEMVALLEALQRCEQPFHCPHGRPTFIVLGHGVLEKEFYRGG
ncbi:MAG: DNA mismatch repair endonuclease MutL [Erysipelotrichaceae bacterium]